MRRSASSTCSALTASWRSYGQHLPRRARMVGDLGDAVRRRLDDLDRARLGVRLLGLADDGAHAVAGNAAGHEHDVALEARDAVAAVGERIDRELEHVAARRSSESGRRHGMCEDDRVSIDDPDELGRPARRGPRRRRDDPRDGPPRPPRRDHRRARRRRRARSSPATAPAPARSSTTTSPASTCISLDDECVHGIPRPRRLREGQLRQARRHRRARRLLRRRLPHRAGRPRQAARAAARRRRAVGAAARPRGGHGRRQRGRDRRAPSRPRSSAAASASAPS